MMVTVASEAARGKAAAYPDRVSVNASERETEVNGLPSRRSAPGGTQASMGAPRLGPGPARLRPSSSLAGPALQRCGCGGACGCERDTRVDLLRRPSAVAPQWAPTEALAVLRGPSRPLDPATREELEPGFGADLAAVRVHDGPDAATAAQSVDARAFTVGQHIVFGAGEYAPGSESGRRLLAHELAHSIQQGPATHTGGAVPVTPAQGRLERDAEAAAAAAVDGSGPATARPVRPGAAALSRQGSGQAGQGGGQTPPVDPVVEQARATAWGRAFRTYMRLSGIRPPAPPGRDDGMQEAAEQLELRNLARTIFSWDPPNMDQITEIVASIRNYLSPGMQTVRAPANDPNCGSREAYVVGHNPPVHLCPPFYRATPDQQADTLAHEAAHLAGIGQPLGESYCPVFDCQTPCGGFQAADSWAHFIHCASGAAPQKPITVTGQTHSAPPAPRTP